jgi:serine/threonine-protein kinase
MLRLVSCLTLETLTSLFARGTTLELRGDVDRHIDECSGCRELVAAYAQALDDSGDATNLANTPYAPTLSSEAPPSREGAHAGDLIGGRYLLLRQVGEGGMGVVWAARDTFHDHEVALKILKEVSLELAGRSMREARAASHVGHPSLLNVLDVLLPPPTSGATAVRAPILVMPLLEGRSLNRVLAERPTLPWRETIQLLLPVLDGMSAAHARGVIHRDLKPENIFLANAQGQAEPITMVLDFGLSKLLSPDGSDAGADKLTRTGAVLGTPYYMAPEQLFGEASVDARADVWAIGAIAYECLTGTRAITGKSYAQIVKNVAKDSVVPLETRAPQVPAALGAQVSAMLSVEREHRPSLGVVHAAWSALLLA